MKFKHVICIGMFAVGFSTSVTAQEADAAIGRYVPPEKDSVIEIFKCGEKYCGKTICIKDNAYRESESADGKPGTPYLDHHNEDVKLRSRPNLGMQFISGFDYVGEGVYKNGKIYNPRDGKTYCGKFTVIGTDKLDLKGTLCSISFIGKTNSWTRLADPKLVDDAKWDCTFKTKK